MNRAGYDVVVAGAGPAGSVAALVLARGGARVALVDKAAFPRDKACGDLVGPRGVGLLDELGVSVPDAGQGADLLVIGPSGHRSRLPGLPGPGLSGPRGGHPPGRARRRAPHGGPRGRRGTGPGPGQRGGPAPRRPGPRADHQRRPAARRGRVHRCGRRAEPGRPAGRDAGPGHRPVGLRHPRVHPRRGAAAVAGPAGPGALADLPGVRLALSRRGRAGQRGHRGRPGYPAESGAAAWRPGAVRQHAAHVWRSGRGGPDRAGDRRLAAHGRHRYPARGREHAAGRGRRRADQPAAGRGHRAGHGQRAAGRGVPAGRARSTRPPPTPTR